MLAWLAILPTYLLEDSNGIFVTNPEDSNKQ
jgi:hypothetical protein